MVQREKHKREARGAKVTRVNTVGEVKAGAGVGGG